MKSPVKIAQHINVDRTVHLGTPVIIGTFLAGGMSQKEVIPEYELTQTHVKAALSYTAELVKLTEVLALTMTAEEYYSAFGGFIDSSRFCDS